MFWGEPVVQYFIYRLRRSLKWKLISIIVSILIFTVSVIGILSYIQTARYVKKDIDQLSVQVLNQANMNLNRYYSEYEMVFLMLGNSLDVRDWLRLSEGPVSSNLIKYYERIKDNYLNRLFLQYPEILSVTLYNPRGREQHFMNSYMLPLSYSIRNEPYFETTGTFEKVKYITGISNNYLNSSNQPMSIPVLTLFKPFYSGYLKMDIFLKPSQSVMDKIDFMDSGIAMVIDETGTIIHHSNSGEVMGKAEDRIVRAVSREREGSIYDPKRKELIIHQTIERTGWKIIAILPYHEIAKSIDYSRNVTIITAIAGLFVSATLTYFAASSITKRISSLRKLMKRMQMKNDFTIRAEVKGMDEVADLATSFNNLLSHLEKSIHDYAEMKVLQHRAVTSALQSQINSHFLYNTLESINSMAVIARQPHIGQVSVSLSNMLRYTSDYKHDRVRLIDELNHLENYLNIMKVRFKDEVTCEIAIPQELHTAMCIKALLQPLVENSIKHVRETAGLPVHIRISGNQFSEKRLRLTVWDNGPGFHPATLAKLRQELANSHVQEYKFTQVGLSNLIYRLRSYYDAEASIRFYNHPEEGGAVAEVELPLQYPHEISEGEQAVHA